MDVLGRTLLAASVAAIIIALAATSADASHSRGKCKQRGATVAKNDSGRVYARGESLYGCLWSRNREILIETHDADDGDYTTSTVGNVMLRGRYVAWVLTFEDISCKADCPPNYDSTTEYVNVFDLARRDGDAVTADPAFDSLRLNTRGSAAWLEIAGSGNSTVHAWDFGTTTDRLLDTGPISRFRLRGRVLSWINGGAQHAVKLP